MKPAFPGNSPGKRLARSILYKHALGSARVGHALTLAGPEPLEELELLRGYLKWPGDRTWFIDNKQSPEIRRALRSIKATWPEAHAENKDLKKVLPNLPVIGFANLDFMGFLTDDNVLPCVKLTARRLVSGGVLGFTWFRGREAPYHTSFQKVLRHSGGYKDLNDKRWTGTVRVIKKATGGSLELLEALEYHNNMSPMSLMVFRKK